MPTHTIAENLTRLQNAKTAIAGAITTAGGTVNSGDGLEDFATDIGTIPSGNSNTVYDPSTGEGVFWYHYIETFAFPEYKYPEEYGDDKVYGPPAIYSGTVEGLEASKCPNLTTIKIPSTVESIDSNTFDSRRFSQITTIIIDKPQNSISGAPWGAKNATVIWTG